jgi:hypothetical protein
MPETAKVQPTAEQKMMPRAIVIPEKKRSNEERYKDWALAAGLGAVAGWAITDGFNFDFINEADGNTSKISNSWDLQDKMIDMWTNANYTSDIWVEYSAFNPADSATDNNSISDSFEKFIKEIDELDDPTDSKYDLTYKYDDATENYQITIEVDGKDYDVNIGNVDQDVANYINVQLADN